MDNKKYIVVITTTETKDEANKISEILIKEKLVACVQISGPIISIYHWQGKVENSEEWRIMAKTREDLYKRVESCILQNHSYSVPQIISVPICNAYLDYLKWIDDNTKELLT